MEDNDQPLFFDDWSDDIPLTQKIEPPPNFINTESPQTDTHHSKKRKKSASFPNPKSPNYNFSDIGDLSSSTVDPPPLSFSPTHSFRRNKSSESITKPNQGNIYSFPMSPSSTSNSLEKPPQSTSLSNPSSPSPCLKRKIPGPAGKLSRLVVSPNSSLSSSLNIGNILSSEPLHSIIPNRLSINKSDTQKDNTSPLFVRHHPEQTSHTHTHGVKMTNMLQDSRFLIDQEEEDEDWWRGPWISMLFSHKLHPFRLEISSKTEDPQDNLLQQKNQKQETISEENVRSIRYVLQEGFGQKVECLCLLIKAFNVSESLASVTFKDPTGEIQGTIHKKLVDTFRKELTVGSVITVIDVSVFTPIPREHYLNITERNLLQVFSSSTPIPEIFQKYSQSYNPKSIYLNSTPKRLPIDQQKYSHQHHQSNQFSSIKKPSLSPIHHSQQQQNNVNNHNQEIKSNSRQTRTKPSSPKTNPQSPKSNVKDLSQQKNQTQRNKTSSEHSKPKSNKSKTRNSPQPIKETNILTTLPQTSPSNNSGESIGGISTITNFFCPSTPPVPLSNCSLSSKSSSPITPTSPLSSSSTTSSPSNVIVNSFRFPHPTPPTSPTPPSPTVLTQTPSSSSLNHETKGRLSSDTTTPVRSVPKDEEDFDSILASLDESILLGTHQF